MNPYDQLLHSRVHPADWINPVPQGRYNLVVIGGGTAGLVAAAGAAGLGAKVALIESHQLGGDCLNVGCVPSKGLIAAARALVAVRNCSEFGVTLPGDPTMDFSTAMDRMRRLRAELSSHDSAQRFRDLGVDVFLGRGQFRGHREIVVNGQVLEFSKAVIATGARALVPPIPGLDQVRYLTNETLFDLPQLPTSLAVVGAGPIGCEMAQTFARLGSEVYLIETAHGILPREEPEARALVQAALEQDGVRILCCGRELRVAPKGERIGITVQTHGTIHALEVDQLLVAAGRTPNVEALGLEEAGVGCDQRGVKVNDRLQTSNPRVFACGDVCSPFQFTHAADFQARLVLQNALFGGRAKASDLLIPWTTYTSPEVARVGLSTTQAAEKGIDVNSFCLPLARVDRAVLDGEAQGFVLVHVKKGSDQLVGATIVGAHAGEMISEVTLAMRAKVGLATMATTIHPYPTQAEALRKVGDLYQRTRLTPLIRRLFSWWLRRSRFER